MKKFAILLTLIAAFAVAGCSSDEKPAPSSQTPQAAPAQKVEINDNIQYNEKGERVFKSRSPKPQIGGKGGQVHQFREKWTSLL